MFNNDRESSQFEHIQYLIEERIQTGKHNVRDLFAFLIFGALIYLGTHSIPLSIAGGLLPVLVLVIQDNIIRKILSVESHRAVHDFEGDIEYLNERIKLDALLNKAVKRWWQ